MSGASCAVMGMLMMNETYKMLNIHMECSSMQRSGFWNSQGFPMAPATMASGVRAFTSASENKMYAQGLPHDVLDTSLDSLSTKLINTM